MKKRSLFFLLVTFYLQTYSQTNCSNANSDVVYAYSHVKSAYESNNIDHLKYWSNRSMEAFIRTKSKLETCGCEKSYNYTYDIVELLSNVEGSETYEDGRFYVKRARDLARKAINELELCTELETSSTQNNSIEEESLSDLKSEQQKLEQQQLKLKLKEEEIKRKLAEQKTKELTFKKEQIIDKNEIAISSNIKAYNNLLTVLDCNTQVNLNYSETVNKDQDIKEIKSHYLNVVKEITTSYLKQLDKCSSR
ncbi:MAG TPA: hypothetical protein VKN14_12650 [Flavobacteriaceae bacterium]|nr:hypothetical protein [Flavobacteriaceae bacterium]